MNRKLKMEPSLYGTSWWLQQLPQKKPHPQSNVQWDHIIAAVEGPAHCQALHEDSKLSMWRGILLLGWYEGTRHRVICLTMNCPSNLSIPIHWQAFPSIWIKLEVDNWSRSFSFPSLFNFFWLAKAGALKREQFRDLSRPARMPRNVRRDGAFS